MNRMATLGAVAIVIVAAIVLLTTSRGTADKNVTASPSAAVQPTASASSTTTATATQASSPSASPGAAVRPDSLHGLIVSTGNLRSEDDPRGLQQPSVIATALGNIGVSPDGRKVALIRTAQTGQQILTFTTARPNDLTTVADLAGSGEVVTRVIWAGDGTGSLLFDAVKETRGPGGGDNAIWEYSALRSVDVATRDVHEIARIAGQNTKLWPLAWLPAQRMAGALEMQQLGPVANYVLVRGGAIERTPMTPRPGVLSFSASRDGQRIVGSFQTSIRWWPVDQPGTMKELPAQAGEHLGRAEFRPGADEIGVEVAEGGRLEIWSLTGQRRVAATRVGSFRFWRADGTAALTAPDPNTVLLVDPSSGASTVLPGGGFPIAEVVLF